MGRRANCWTAGGCGLPVGSPGQVFTMDCAAPANGMCKTMANDRKASMITNDPLALQTKAKWVWRETLKVHRHAPETRIASSLSPIEIFVALYYGGVLRFDPQNPRAEE